jgi:hypothetical protein
MKSNRWPIGHLLNPAFRYVPSFATDIRATFARVVAQRQAKP